MPATHFDSPPPRRSVTMPIVDLRNDTQVTSWPYPSYPSQVPITSLYGSHSGATRILSDRQRDRAYVSYTLRQINLATNDANGTEDNSDYEEDDPDISTMQDGGTLAKSPRGCSIVGMQKLGEPCTPSKTVSMH